MTVKKVSADSNVLLKGLILDVRTSIEHKEQSLGLPHIHIPLDQLNVAEFLKSHNLKPHDPLYILCRSGRRAETAAKAFMEAGFDNVHVIDGGIVACGSCNIELCKQPVISLERQVRIAAGLFVLIGIFLGSYVSAVFYGLSAFVGAGLVFAGITDWCGMGLLLARAPWNRC